MQYTTKQIEKWLEQNCQSRQALNTKQMLRESAEEWIGEMLEEGDLRRLTDQYISLAHHYADEGEFLLAVDRDFGAAKRRYYLAALASRLVCRLAEAGFPHSLRDGAGPYDFKKHNLNFSKNAILANAPELARAIAGEDTAEGMLVRGEDDLARRSLPQAPEQIGDCLRQALWGVAHGNRKWLDRGLQKRLGELRRQGARCPAPVDSQGLAVVRLAQQRGMACGVGAFELPWQLLDDTPADSAGLVLPYEAEVQKILEEKQR